MRGHGRLYLPRLHNDTGSGTDPVDTVKGPSGRGGGPRPLALGRVVRS
jgi:hypothetical protein